ncbi:hypothetical protein GUITHDRAFT_154056 [Guillardia theta CCMP2712]|uniref:Uncharacterized protein n=1 Tax=Guillardia theta (strain CCMP2712) TaxID=905079 RepID=L1IXY8_GUITC|nr:hypothetical protein GUITHDRAFT_154056 [Guillardia theta CCMP2712]EKX40695.1 hypothetical protein GUITHDRAFT_154056 [Guillardia theta CCMP2712]|eukprot:XP_005827675.1 hypothetical protein GUITHDRAFT_154056 [Guillardia theta CCMP2712]
MHRMMPLPWYDESSTIQNQRNALRIQNGPNTATGGSPAKLEGLGINVDDDPLQVYSVEGDRQDNARLKEQGVRVSHFPFNIYKAVPNVLWDKTQFDAKTEEPRAIWDPKQVQNSGAKLERRGVKVNSVPQLPPWSEEVKGESRSYVDGMFDRSMDVSQAHSDFIESSPDGQPLHPFLNGEVF